MIWSIWPTEKASTVSSLALDSSLLSWRHHLCPQSVQYCGLMGDSHCRAQVISMRSLLVLLCLNSLLPFLFGERRYHHFVIPLPRSKAYNYALRFHKMILGSSDLAKDPPRCSVFWYLIDCGFSPFLSQVPAPLHSLCAKLHGLGSVLERLMGTLPFTVLGVPAHKHLLALRSLTGFLLLFSC